MRRNLGIVRISPDVLVQFLTRGAKAFYIDEAFGLPPGSQIVNARWNFDRASIDVVVSHPSLPWVEEGSQIPDVEVQIRPDEDYSRLMELGSFTELRAGSPYGEADGLSGDCEGRSPEQASATQPL